jgi:hypothetical protein
MMAQIQAEEAVVHHPCLYAASSSSYALYAFLRYVLALCVFEPPWLAKGSREKSARAGGGCSLGFLARRQRQKTFR